MTSSTYVKWIIEDHKKNLWLNTDLGIIKLNAEKNTTVIYAKDQGVDGGALNTSGYIRKNGEILFGDTTGYFAFRPKQLAQNIPAPLVNITNFLLSSKAVAVGKGSVLPLALSQTKTIRLQHSQNTFSFEFASIDYASTGTDNQLQYMLENYDHNWQKAGENKAAYYFNVAPGTYIFKVKAVNEIGVWAEKDITIIVSPPWWKTWWAYTLYAVCFLVILFFANRAIRNRIIEKERMKSREKELAQAKEIEKAYNELKLTQSQLIQSEKMASLGELTAGIAHEIQNPLNFVNNFSEVSNEMIDEMNEELNKGDIEEAKAISSDIKQNLEKINHHGKRAGEIVKGMLQHSRTSTGVKEPTDINALADEYLRFSYHGLRAKDKTFNAEIKTDFDETIGKINIIPQDIGRVLFNLYNNAFYACAEQSRSAVNQQKSENLISYEPTVSVSTKRSGNSVLITVKDNGGGIPEKIKEKIFQPFFTTKPTGSGTGLGLSLSYDIVKAHGGEINVETKEGDGYRVYYSITGTTKMKMKIKVKLLNITTLLLLASGTCYAQTKEVVDSLKSILATTKNDTTKIYAQANLCDAYRFGNVDSSTFYGQQALKLARKINFIPGQILALGFLTAPAQQQGDYPKTLQLGFEAIQLAKEHHLDVLAAPAMSNMAAVYANLKDYQKAIDYSHQQILLELAGHIDRHIDPDLLMDTCK